jgi:hypothetical protein
MKTYGGFDGTISASYATAFVAVARTLIADQRAALQAMRTKLLGNLTLPTGAYRYSEPITMPVIPSTDFLFAK